MGEKKDYKFLDIRNGLSTADVALDREQAQLYRRCLILLDRAGVQFVTGGAFALYAYTGILRNTKDFDVFLLPEHLKEALALFQASGLRTEITDDLWLAKVFEGDYFVDLLFGIPSKRFMIDKQWIERSHTAEIMGLTVPMISIEELIVSKAYLARRVRFDGADIVHLIRGAKGRIDWKRVLSYMENDPEILLWHLVLFQFVYPGHLDYLPSTLMDEIYERTREDRSKPKDPKAFRGMIIDPVSFAVDTEVWGYEDVRDMEPLVGIDGERI